MSDPPAPPEATTVAAIDIGANAIRMVVAEVLPDGRTTVLERTQRAVGLGQDTFVTGRLSRQTMGAAISILSDYKRLLETYRVKHVRAVATSAVREAGNSDAFLDRVYTSCGLDVEVIDPSEESRLTVSAVHEELARLPDVDRRDALVADVGGGSALLTVLQRGQIVASESYRLGSIRIQETLSISDSSPARTADLIRHQIAGVMAAVTTSLPLEKVQTFVAVGGDARFVARHIGQPTASENLHTIGVKAFNKLVRQCAGHTTAELARRWDLPYADAQTLVPALLVYQALMGAAKAHRIIVADTSMRDGLLMDLARIVTGREDQELIGNILRSARTVAKKYRCDSAHASHVADLAVRLFDELQPDHGLTARHRLLLRVAGLLHEAGGFVSTRAHHKHSYYLLANAEVFGLRREEMEIVALLARYHRRSVPKRTHLEYMGLPREKRVVVSKAAALLRVADALDRGHAQQVRDFDIERAGDEVAIYVRGVTDLTLERRALSQKSDLFEDAYGMKVRLEEAPLPPPPAAGGAG